MAYALRALAGFATLAFAPLPSAAVDEQVSLLQTSARLVEEVARQKRASGGIMSRGLRNSWPNPADPNATASWIQRLGIRMLKRHPFEMREMLVPLSGIAITPVPYVVAHGGYDILFGALHNYANDTKVQMHAFVGLSDQSHTEVGSHFISNYGGPNKGIEYMVEQLKAHPAAGPALFTPYLTYQYEVFQCLSGLLSWDVNGTRGAAAVRAGLLEAAVHALDVERDRRPTADVACGTLAALLSHDRSHAARLKELGAEELVQRAIARFSKDDPRPFLFGTTLGSMYPVAPRCRNVSKYLSSVG